MGILKIGITATVAAGAVVGIAAGNAHAATAYMDGLFNVGPGWSTITLPDGSRCAKGCTEVRYNYLSADSAAKAAGAWMDQHNTPDDVLVAYSMASIGTVSALAARPNWKGKVILLGSPARDVTNDEANGGRPWSTSGNVTFVSVEGDSVAFPGGSFSRHLTGYKNRDFSTEIPVWSSKPTPNVTDNVYAPPAARFNLFDMRTWFAPRTSTTTATPTRAVADDAPAADAKRPTAAERRAERRAELKAARAERRQVLAERRAAREEHAAERKAAREERAAGHRVAREAKQQPPSEAAGESPSS